VFSCQHNSESNYKGQEITKQMFSVTERKSQSVLKRFNKQTASVKFLLQQIRWNLQGSSINISLGFTMLCHVVYLLRRKRTENINLIEFFLYYVVISE